MTLFSDLQGSNSLLCKVLLPLIDRSAGSNIQRCSYDILPHPPGGCRWRRFPQGTWMVPRFPWGSSGRLDTHIAPGYQSLAGSRTQRCTGQQVRSGWLHHSSSLGWWSRKGQSLNYPFHFNWTLEWAVLVLYHFLRAQRTRTHHSTSPFVVQAHDYRVRAWCVWLPWISRSVCAIRQPCWRTAWRQWKRSIVFVHTFANQCNSHTATRTSHCTEWSEFSLSNYNKILWIINGQSNTLLAADCED